MTQPIQSRSAGVMPPGYQASYLIRRADGTKEPLATSEASPAIFLPPGRYRVEGRYGPAGIALTRDIDVQAGQAQEAGLTIELLERSPADLRRDVEIDHTYDLAYYSWDFPDHTYRLRPLLAAKRNYLGYDGDDELESALVQLLNHREFNRVQKLTHDLHRRVHERLPFIPLWQLDTQLVVHPRLELPAQLDGQSLFSDVETWKLEVR